jgi:transposase
MGFRTMTTEELALIFRRWHAGHTISSIKAAVSCDRKTIRNYITLFTAAGYTAGCPFPDEQKLFRKLQAMLPLKSRRRGVRNHLLKHKDEIVELVTRKEEPVKPKNAFLIIKEKYDVPVSYETFKLFMREHAFSITKTAAPLRIELPPGKEIQLDYGQVGRLYDPDAKHNRLVYAFCARLSFSRLPFIMFVYAQNQESFVESQIEMAEFFGGLTEFLSLDNLKAGVIKPHLYDPEINRAYADFAAHYGVFLSPCRVGKATDKGKIERLVPGARELFRRLKEVHPSFTLSELNEHALKWCREEYGQAKHGTTGIPPVVLFEEEEKAALKPLPETRFEVPVWKQVKVAPDRFITFEGKYYCLPYEYRGRTLLARKSGVMLRIFNQNHVLVREYVISLKRFSWLPGDFPEDREALMQGEYPQWLLKQARSFGPSTEKLIASVLESHAYLHARRARGILSLLEKYRSHPFREEICLKACALRVHTPKQIHLMLEREMRQLHFDFVVPTSPAGRAMIRDVNEYLS